MAELLLLPSITAFQFLFNWLISGVTAG